MIIKEILKTLETTKGETPVIKLIHKNDNSKLMALGFNKGMVLGNHQTDIPATLIVLQGVVNYQEEGRNIIVNALEELSIPVNVTHSVTALQDSMCIVIRA